MQSTFIWTINLFCYEFLPVTLLLQRYRASALNLVVAAIILWNTVYLAEAVELLKQQGMTVNEELLRHLSPLGWEHITLTGDYLWNMKQTPVSGQLRPLRLKTK